MKKQTQSRQYGYVSPKCKTIRLEQGYCNVTSPNSWNPGGAGNSGSLNEDEEL